jgi:5'-deoxynucleotidase YfbR-like HD superfamily hydrolase
MEEEISLIKRRLDKIETSLQKVEGLTNLMGGEDKLTSFLLNELRESAKWHIEREIFDKRISELEHSVKDLYKNLKEVEFSILKSINEQKEYFVKIADQLRKEQQELNFKTIAAVGVIVTIINIVLRFLADFISK